jgi:hypothetical protein
LNQVGINIYIYIHNVVHGYRTETSNLPGMFWACGSRKEGGTYPTFKALLLTKLSFNSDGFFVIEGENGVGRRGWRRDSNLGVTGFGDQ